MITPLRPAIWPREYFLFDAIAEGMPACMGFAVAPTFTMELKDATIYGDGAVRLESGEVIWKGLILSNYQRLGDVERTVPTSSYDEPLAFVGGFDNFGHTVIEHLTRLAVLELGGRLDRRVAVWPGSRIVDFLSLADIEFRVVEQPAKFKDVVVPSCPVGRDLQGIAYAWRDALWWVRNKFMPRIPAGKRRIFCRRIAKTRMIRNEPEVMAVLADYGFECMNLADMPLRDQLETVAQSEILVMAGGASSPIACWARGAVIELWPNKGAATFGAFILCVTFGLPIMRIPTTDTAKDSYSDYTVDIAALRLNVQRVIDRKVSAATYNWGERYGT